MRLCRLQIFQEDVCRLPTIDRDIDGRLQYLIDVSQGFALHFVGDRFRRQILGSIHIVAAHPIGGEAGDDVACGQSKFDLLPAAAKQTILDLPAPTAHRERRRGNGRHKEGRYSSASFHPGSLAWHALSAILH